MSIMPLQKPTTDKKFRLQMVVKPFLAWSCLSVYALESGLLGMTQILLIFWKDRNTVDFQERVKI